MEKRNLLLPTHVTSFTPPKYSRTLRPWRRSRLHTRSNLRHGIRCFLLVFALLGSIVACSYFSLFSSVIPPIATVTKNNPTDFGLLFGSGYDIDGTAWSQMPPEQLSRWNLRANGELGSGKEGWAGLALDDKSEQIVVMKQIRRHHSVERNQVPSEIKRGLSLSTRDRMTWPTEIPATLLLSRLSSSIASAGGSDLVPLLGYSFARSEFFHYGTEPTWHIITPYMAHGNLASFGKSLKQQNSSTTIRQLDFHYRPTLEKLLLSLSALGDAKICHDDVKASNIFVSSDRSWHLGDFGQVREASMSYHHTRFWTNGQQLADCTHNDLRRALRSYLVFLREAASTQFQKTFDEELFAARQPWARLYWQFVDAPRSGRDLVALSRSIPPHASSKVTNEDRAPGRVLARFMGRRWVLRHATQWELSCKIANPWDLMGPHAWLFWGWSSARPLAAGATH